jgi:hypothetical protein
MRRVVWWVGDRFVWMEGRPVLFFAFLFFAAWIVVTLIAHFAHLHPGDSTVGHLRWEEAASVGFGLACLATLLGFWAWRRA